MDAGMQIGQTFTAGRSGLLDTVTLYMQRFGGGVGDVTFRIESVTGGGVPNDGDVLAQVTEPASALGDIKAPFNSITFPAPANVVAGQRYAFVVGRTAARQFNYQLSAGNAYAAGSAVFDFGGGWRTSAQAYGPTEFDLNFSTFVSPADSTAPVTTDDVPSSWQSSPVAATLTATDAGSGVAATYYTTDGTTPTTASNIYDPLAPPLLTDGEYVAYFSVDHVGNTETVKTSTTAKVDTTPPTTTDDAPSAWQTAPVTVTLSATDADSGVAATYYTTDGTTPTTSSSEYDANNKPVLHDGERIRYFSVDQVGNSEAVQSSPAARVDTTAPTTTHDVPTAWQTAPVTVTLSATDAGSGVATTYYTTDGSAPTTSSSAYDANNKPVLHDGESIAYFSIDAAGNAESVQTSPAAKVDTTAPTTTDDVPSAWQAAPVTVTLSASDASSGVAATYYTTDGSAPTTASAAYDPAHTPVLHDGEKIAYFSVDLAGNAEQVETSPAAKVDTTAPVVTYSGNTGTYTVDQTVHITCAAGDPSGSGVASSTCQDVDALAGTLGVGTHTVSATATDNVGNTGSGSATYTVTAPTTAQVGTMATEMVQGTAAYRALTPTQKAAVDSAVSAAVTQIASIKNAKKKAKAIADADTAIQAAAVLGGLSQAEADTLKTLIAGL